MRRQLILALTAGATLATIGLALSHSWALFQAMSFITGVLTVVPQILNPLAADLAKPEHRSKAVSIVISGLIGGQIVGRLCSGLFARYSTGGYRNVYFFSIGLQALTFVMLWWFIPDYPKKANTGLTYPGILKSMLGFIVSEPTLIQACLIGFLSMAIFVSFWTNLTYLLEAAPYNLDAFDIGLFGLVGFVTLFVAPRLGVLTDRLHPWTATAIGLGGQLVTCIIVLACARLSYGAVIIGCIFTDICQQAQQIGNQTRVYKLHPLARGRLNGCYGTFVFLGQAAGSSAGSKVFLQYGDRAAYGMACAWSAAAICILLLRGPYAEYGTSWIGWSGVYTVRKGAPKPGTDTELETGDKAKAADRKSKHEASDDGDASKDDGIETAVEDESIAVAAPEELGRGAPAKA